MISAAIFRQKPLLFIPKRLGKIHIIPMGILKAKNFVPHGIDLFLTIPAAFLHGRYIVDTFAAAEKLFLQGNGPEILHRFPLPYVFRIKNLIRSRIIDGFIVKSDDICDSLAGFLIVQPP